MPVTEIRDITLEDGFLDMYDKYYPRVFSFVYFRVQNRAVCEDIVSETFIKAFEKRHSYDAGKAAVSTWLFTIALNCTASHFRRSKRIIFLDTEPDESTEPFCVSAEDSALHSEDIRILTQYMAKLKERERTAVYLRYREDMSHSEIAELLGTTPKAVSMLLTRALGKLRKWFK